MFFSRKEIEVEIQIENEEEKMGEDYMNDTQKAIVMSLSLPAGTWVVFHQDNLIAYSENLSEILNQTDAYSKANNVDPSSLFSVQLGKRRIHIGTIGQINVGHSSNNFDDHDHDHSSMFKVLS